MDRPRIRPDLDDAETWDDAVDEWRRGALDIAVFDLQGLGSADNPIPGELLALLPDTDNSIGLLDCAAAHLGPVSWVGCTFYGDANFKEAEFHGAIDFSNARFVDKAVFREAQFWTDTHFSGVEFDENADFGWAEFSAGAYFGDAHFGGNAYYFGTSFVGSAHFGGARFGSDADFVESRAVQGISLSDALVDAGSHEFRFSGAPGVNLVIGAGLRVEGDLIVQLSEMAAFDATGITVRAPMSLIGSSEDPQQPGGQLVSVVGADITAPFRVGRRIDLGETIWGDHDLTSITLASTESFQRTGGLYRLVHQPYLPGWVRAIADGRRKLAADNEELDHTALPGLERNYRDLRRQLETIGNIHGANDFYYGEMEARRRQLRWSSPYRWLLETYRAISGYGTRAWSAIVAWQALILIATRLLLINGIDINQSDEYLSWGRVWRFALESSLSFFRPTSAPLLTVPETLIMVVLRILGPVLLALAAISVRNQTKR